MNLASAKGSHGVNRSHGFSHKTTKKTLCIIIILFFSYFNNASCQIYKRAFGMKMGGYNGYVGITVKEFLNQRMSLENSIMMIRPLKESRRMSLQVLLQVNQEFDRNTSFYCSFGPSIIFKENREFNKSLPSLDIRSSNQTKLALNTFVGIDRQLSISNLFFSFDTGPSIHFNSKVQVKYMLNFSLKYTVKHIGFKPHRNFSTTAYRKWSKF